MGWHSCQKVVAVLVVCNAAGKQCSTAAIFAFHDYDYVLLETKSYVIMLYLKLSVMLKVRKRTQDGKTSRNDLIVAKAKPAHRGVFVMTSQWGTDLNFEPTFIHTYSNYHEIHSQQSSP